MIGLAAILAAAAAPVISPAPEGIALTLYRAPWRGSENRMDLSNLGGFALVTETRTIAVPMGDAVIRFEGVADGIIPASAIVTGLPGGTIEKNRDARLLSPLSLVDGSLGREVTVRRIDRLTGRVREERATIIAVPVKGAGGVVMRTPEGIETWRCPGVPEKLVYDRVPSGLSAKPVLSVTTHSQRASRVRVTLAYLSTGFDWNATYVATLPRGDSDTLNLFAWASLANANGQSFPGARVQIVAGRLERRTDREIVAAAAKLELHCFRLGTTSSDLPVIGPYVHIQSEDLGRFPEIVVTGMRRSASPAILAAAPPAPPPPPPLSPENLGDLKLYRLPEPVTILPNAQKQVALIAQPKVRFEKVYRIKLGRWDNDQEIPAAIILRFRNTEQEGAGVPLPSGTTSLYQEGEIGRLLVGLGKIGDTAKGDQARIAAGTSSQVSARQRAGGADRHITLSNANPFPVRVEVTIGNPGEKDFRQTSAPLARVDGVQTWRVTVPANKTVSLDYGPPSS